MSASHSGRIIRILTTDFPQYFAIVTRIKQEVHVIGAEGGILISSVASNVQAVFPAGALTKKIKVGLQASKALIDTNENNEKIKVFLYSSSGTCYSF